MSKEKYILSPTAFEFPSDHDFIKKRIELEPVSINPRFERIMHSWGRYSRKHGINVLDGYRCPVRIEYYDDSYKYLPCSESEAKFIEKKLLELKQEDECSFNFLLHYYYGLLVEMDDTVFVKKLNINELVKASGKSSKAIYEIKNIAERVFQEKINTLFVY